MAWKRNGRLWWTHNIILKRRIFNLLGPFQLFKQIMVCNYHILSYKTQRSAKLICNTIITVTPWMDQWHFITESVNLDNEHSKFISVKITENIFPNSFIPLTSYSSLLVPSECNSQLLLNCVKLCVWLGRFTNLVYWQLFALIPGCVTNRPFTLYVK